MSLKELLVAKRTVYVLAEKPCSNGLQAQYWYMDLGGLHQDHLKSSVTLLREQERKNAETRSKQHALKPTALLNSLARALGAASYDAWLEHEQPKIIALLGEHGMNQPADLIKWVYPPYFSGALTARQVSDRIFNSRLPLPDRIFTGVGSTLFAPSGYGRLDINQIAGKNFADDVERLEFCRRHSDEVLLQAQVMRDADAPTRIDLTGRMLMLHAVRESVGCGFNMLGDNLCMPRLATTPELTLYNAEEDARKYDAQIFELFRQQIERSDEGWIDVISVPGNDRLVFLKGPKGTFDWIVRDQRETRLTSNPLYPFFKKDEIPSAMDTSQIAACRYFTPGEWEEKLKHDAEARHYAEGCSASNWPGYEKLIERQLMAAHRFVPPRRIPGPASDGFVSHRVGDYRLMVSPLVTIAQFNSFLDETGWAQTRLDKADKAQVDLERDLGSVNGRDAGDLPVSVTWFDAVAYCRDYEKRHGFPVRLLDPEEWKQIAPPPSVDRSRVKPVCVISCQGGERPDDPVYEQLNWAVVGGDGRPGKNSTHCDRPDGILSFGPNLVWQQNREGLPFLSVAGFMEWLSGYQNGFAPFAEAGRGIVSTGASIFGALEQAGRAMRHEGAKVGFRLCYVAHLDA